MVTIVSIAAAATLAAFFVYFPITDTDIFWHLAAGREMVTHKHLLFTDPFAFTLASPEWIDLHWVFQLIVYGLHSIGGEGALLAFKLFCVAMTTGILCRVHGGRRYAAVTSLVAIVLFYDVRYLICLRPVLITMMCMATYLFLFERARRTRRDRMVWWCLPLQLLWTNSQGLYMIGLFIIGAYWVERFVDRVRMKRPPPLGMTLLVVVATASCMINPWGIRGLLLPLTLFGRTSPAAGNIYSMNIAENVPLLSLTGYEFLYTMVVAAATIIICILFILNRSDLRPAHYLLFGGFLFLAWRAERNVLLYVVGIIPIIGYHASRCSVVQRAGGLLKKPGRLKFMFTVTSVLVAMFFVIRHAMVVATFPPHRTLSPFRFPEKICDYIKEHPCEGRLFNDIRHGGYLIWKLYPHQQVFIDGRLIIRSPGFFREYLTICANPALFQQVADKFDISQVILPWAVFGLQRELIGWLYHSDKWQLEFTDGASLLFIRSNNARLPALTLSDPAVAVAIRDSIALWWHDAPYVRREATLYYAEMLDSLRCRESAAVVRPGYRK